MQFTRLVRESPEVVYVLIRNSYSTAALSNGQFVSLDMATDLDGYSATKPNGVLRSCGLGMMALNSSTIAACEYGKCQVYGWATNARVSGGSGANTSKATAGASLYLKTSGFCAYALNFLASAATIPAREHHPLGYIGAPTNTAARATSTTTSAYKVFLRCL